MCENLWDLGARNKLNRRGMNCGYVGCGRTMDWVLIPGIPLFSMRLWKHSTTFLAVFGASNCTAASTNTVWERTLCPPQISLSFQSNIYGIRFKI